MYDFLIKELYGLGWDGNPSSYNAKSYVVWVPTIAGPGIRIQIGLVDYDTKSHSMQTKLPGQAGFKCDIDLSEFKPKEFNPAGLEIALKLVRRAGYVGKGAGGMLGIRNLSPIEINKWSWILNHRPGGNWRDFTSKDKDMKHLKSMLVLEIVKEVVGNERVISTR